MNKLQLNKQNKFLKRVLKSFHFKKSNGDLYGAIFPQKFIAAINLEKIKF
jgi:hypothetical protein